MKPSIFLKGLVLAGMMLGLPMLGVLVTGMPVERYLEFPPETRYVAHAPFSWAAFISCIFIIALPVLPLLIRGIRAAEHNVRDDRTRYPFPWWGRVGITTGLGAWVLAWNRFDWFESLQPHTFPFLWGSFILVVNALVYRRKGRCMMVSRPLYFALLFPLSAAFWWFFEYLNRFVQNWHYAGVPFDAFEYFMYATLSFSTVLPAVLGTCEWISTFQWMERGFGEFIRVRIPASEKAAWITLVVSGAGLALLGVFPDYLFPLLWISPLFMIVSMMTLLGQPHVFSGLARGDWRVVVSSSLAALFCGLFWEMWNYYSLAKWHYSVPFVHSWEIFEMPVLGYAGYLPFGLECALIGDILDRAFRQG